MKAPEKVVLSWSGGKDSAMALHTLRQDERYEVVGLLTTVAKEFRRISHHGVRDDLLERQARAVGMGLTRVWLPTGPSHGCTNAIYEQLLGETLEQIRESGVQTIAHGDIFLQDLREYRERNLAKVGMRAVFPLWNRDTSELLREFVALGFRAHITCVDGNRLPAAFAGRSIDGAFVEELPDGIDPCGENGEYHSFVWDGPVFQWPVPVALGEVVQRDTRYFADLVHAGPQNPSAPTIQHIESEEVER